jgi:hypothetical protein
MVTLKKKISNLNKRVIDYDELDNIDKIGEAKKIIKKIKKCQDEIDNNLEMITKKDDHLLESPDEITETDFKKYVKNAKKLKEEYIAKQNNNGSVEDLTIILIDLTKCTNYIKQYLKQNRDIEVTDV